MRVERVLLLEQKKLFNCNDKFNCKKSHLIHCTNSWRIIRQQNDISWFLFVYLNVSYFLKDYIKGIIITIIFYMMLSVTFDIILETCLHPFELVPSLGCLLIDEDRKTYSEAKTSCPAGSQLLVATFPTWLDKVVEDFLAKKSQW